MVSSALGSSPKGCRLKSCQVRYLRHTLLNGVCLYVTSRYEKITFKIFMVMLSFTSYFFHSDSNIQ